MVNQLWKPSMDWIKLQTHPNSLQFGSACWTPNAKDQFSLCQPFYLQWSGMVSLLPWTIMVSGITTKNLQPNDYWLTDGRTDRRMGRRTDRRTDCGTDGKTDGRIDGQTDWLMHWQTDWLTDSRTEHLTDCLTHWLTDQANDFFPTNCCLITPTSHNFT